MRRWSMFLLIPFTAALYTGWTCGPGLPPNYLSGMESYVLGISRSLFTVELHRILNPDSTAKGFRNPFDSATLNDDLTDTDEVHFSGKKKDHWSNTLQADVKDVQNALEEKRLDPDEIDSIADQYAEMRQSMNQENATDELYSDKHTEKPMFDFSPYLELLNRLPQEFNLYVEGAAHYRANRFEEAVSNWRDVLALPKEERRYRSVWSAYMLGKAHLVKDVTQSVRRYGDYEYTEVQFQRDATQAIIYFKQAQELAQAGFIDSVGLAIDSDGWIAHCHTLLGQYKEAIHYYLEEAEQHSFSATVSLRNVCQQFTSQAQIAPELIHDTSSRWVITAWMTGLRKTFPQRERWLGALEHENPALTEGEADRIAWLSYQLGDFERARRWLNQANELTPEGKWVQSKLMLRDGEIDKAVTLLRSLIPEFGSRANTGVLNELGVIQLGRKEYLQALDLFMQTGYKVDAAYIAEYVLTIDELESVIERYPEKHGDYFSLSLPDILSKRYARERNFEKALQYASPENRPHLEEFATHFQQAQDPSNPDEVRGEAYFHAAELLYSFGMEMQGTYTDPDWSYYHGYYKVKGPLQTRHTLPEKGYSTRLDIFGKELDIEAQVWNPQLLYALTAGVDELQRAQSHLPRVNERFHYRYLASELMWKSAQLLPDNDIRTAHALYCGGMYLKKREPQMADRFYKALVNRCKQLHIGQEADRRRWFPPLPFEDYIQPDPSQK